MLMLIEGAIGAFLFVVLAGVVWNLICAAITSVVDFSIIEILYVIAVCWIITDPAFQLVWFALLALFNLCVGRWDKATLIAILVAAWANLYAYPRYHL